MHYAAGTKLLQDPQIVLGAVPCVNDDRQVQLLGKIQLFPQQHTLAPAVVALIVIVQPDLPDRNNFRVLRQLLQLCQIIGRLLSGGFGVNAHCRIDVVVSVGKGNAGGAVLQRGAGKDSVDNAGFGQCRQDFVPVCIKCTVGVVAVGVKNLGKHGSFLSVKCLS